MANRKILYGYQIIHGDLVIQEESSRRRNDSLFKIYLPPIWPGYPIRHWQTG